jgi:hypothetical protein
VVVGKNLKIEFLVGRTAAGFTSKDNGDIWIFGSSSPAAFKLYPHRSLHCRLHSWDLVRSDKDFWANPRQAASIPIGTLSWQWLKGRSNAIALHKQEDPSRPCPAISPI